MLDVVISNKCKKDLRRAQKRGLDMEEFFHVVELLQKQELLPAQYRDHALVGKKDGLRDCHIKPDWVLIYQVREADLILLLVETGTHSDLGI